ncbi:MAG TPA: PAS domain S-box protein, partial [Acidobacteriaceae bacterium]
KEMERRGEAEEEIREYTERFQNFVESTPDYAMYMLDLEGRVLTWNAGAERIKGYRAEEIIGKPTTCFYTEEDRKAGIPEASLLAASGGGYVAEAWRVRKDGSRFRASVTIRPLYDKAGALRGFAKITRDLTKTRAAEHRFEMVFEHAPEAMLICDGDGRILMANARMEKLYRYTRAELLGESVDMLTPEAYREGARERRRELIAQVDLAMTGRRALELDIGYDRRGLRKDGGSFLLEVRLTPIVLGDEPALLMLHRDMTARYQAERRFASLLESAPDAMLIVGSGGKIELANLQSERIFGYSREELLGQPVEMLIPDHLRLGHVERRAAYAAAPRYRQMGMGMDLEAVRKDGTHFPVEVSLSPLEEPDGLSVTAAIRDVTDRRKAEVRFRGLLESAPDAMLIVDSAGKIELANLQSERIFGYRREELLGQPVEMLIPEHLRTGHVQRRAEYAAAPRYRQMGMGMELEAVRKDGTRFPVEVSLSPLEDPDGLSVMAAIRDVTDRRKAESRFRGLLESAPDAMVISNREGVIELVNLQAERLFGYAREEMVGQPVEMLMPRDLRENYQRDLEGFFQGQGMKEADHGLELRAVRKDGTEFPVEINFSPIEGSDGFSMIAAIRDLTERRKAGQLLAEKVMELRNSNEELEQFAYIASHDLQEPLRMVASYTQLLARRYKGKLDSDAEEFIHYAVDGTQRMKRLIEDLLMYSRAGKVPPPTERISADQVMRQTLHNLQARIAETGAKVTAEPLPTVIASEVVLGQIFQNLVGNAIKYCKERTPEIRVDARDGGSEWIFAVADNGIGIDPQYFERIFLIFQRLHGRQEYEGTGIGLAICKRMLSRMGGRIWVESVPGDGSTFFFSLPKG